jgi:hypothetical protein
MVQHVANALGVRINVMSCMWRAPARALLETFTRRDYLHCEVMASAPHVDPMLATRLRVAPALIFLTLSTLCSLSARAEDEAAEIVMSCHYSNAEWGTEAIDRCVKENQALREQVLQYAAAHRHIVERCRGSSEWGWAWVKNCVDRDIEAEAELAQYPKDQAASIAACQAEFGRHAFAKVKKCVDKAAEPGSGEKN